MKKSDRLEMHNNIQKHGKNLNTIFNTDLDPVILCKKLFRLERKAHNLSLDWCNGKISIEFWEIETDKILNRVVNILGGGWFTKLGIFVNGDARGYALKIDDRIAEKMDIYKDWGGYGIIAPDFNPS